MPKPTPTPRPTPAPVAATGAQAKFDAFKVRTVAYTVPAADLLGAISDDANNYDLEGLGSDAQELRNGSLTYLDWLDAHPAAACYKQVWTLSRQMATDMAESMRYMIQFVDNLDPVAGGKGNTLMKTGNEEAVRVAAALGSVSCPE